MAESARTSHDPVDDVQVEHMSEHVEWIVVEVVHVEDIIGINNVSHDHLALDYFCSSLRLFGYDLTHDGSKKFIKWSQCQIIIFLLLFYQCK